jgi:hypothetical protein
MRFWRRYRFPATLAGVQALLLGLRLTGVTRWPWWLVLAPVIVIAGLYVAWLALVMVALGNWGKKTGS